MSSGRGKPRDINATRPVLRASRAASVPRPENRGPRECHSALVVPWGYANITWGIGDAPKNVAAIASLVPKSVLPFRAGCCLVHTHLGVSGTIAHRVCVAWCLAPACIGCYCARVCAWRLARWALDAIAHRTCVAWRLLTPPHHSNVIGVGVGGGYFKRVRAYG